MDTDPAVRAAMRLLEASSLSFKGGRKIKGVGNLEDSVKRALERLERGE